MNEIVNDLVSVIIPTHNRARILKRTIESVLAQTYVDFELIIVSDGSTDNTEQVVALHNDSRIAYFEHEYQKGASASRNTGIAVSRGSFIAFLDDDDEWLPTKLEKQMLLMQNSPETVGLIYCWMDYCDDKGRVVYRHYPRYKGYIFPYVLDSQRIGGCPTLLVRRSAVGKIGGFDESLPRGNDGDFIRRICLHYNVDFIPEVLVKVHVEHEYQRITSFSQQGIRNAIKGHKAKLDKFQNELHKYHRQTANIYASIARLYSQLGDWQKSFAFYLQALKVFPFSLKVYVNILKSIKMRLMKQGLQ